MLQGNEHTMQTTVDAWADIVTKQWRGAINKLNIHSTGALYESIAYDVIGGDYPQFVRFSFNYYGIHVNFGHGKEISVGNRGDLGFTPERKPKYWYTPVIYRETAKLSEILANKFGENAAGLIVDRIQSGIIEDNARGHFKREMLNADY